MPSKVLGEVLENMPLTRDVYEMAILAPEFAGEAKPGQFVEIKCGELPLLRRPISIYDVDKEKGVFRLIYQIRGDGTKKLSQMSPGGKIDLLGPLGKGFTITSGKGILIGGGIGVPPLYYLGKEIKKQGGNIISILGFNDKDTLYGEEAFAELGDIHVATMDGSYGVKGHIGAVLENLPVEKNTTLYACGPEPMLNYVKMFGENKNLDVELSLEAYMGCGVGACLSCVCEKKDGSYARVCTDGPVFKGKDVVFHG